MSIQFPDIDPVALDLGLIQIRWYSLAYIAGFLFSYWYINKIAVQKDRIMSSLQLERFISYSVLGVILGGRLGYILFYNLDFYAMNPMRVLYLWEGGMSFHGAAIGLCITVWLCALREKIDSWYLFDVISCCVPLGLCLGRITNFINAELYGRTTEIAWGVIFPNAGLSPRHPSQIYEAILEGVLPFIILNVLRRFQFFTAGKAKLCGMFCLLYGGARIFVEQYREPDYQLGFIYQEFTMGQVLSLPILVVGIILVSRRSLNVRNI